MRKHKPKKFCCERLKNAYKEGLLRYTYELTNEIDETDWFVEGFYHLYYCPFCGAYIKGNGFGDYEKKYPPAKNIRVINQVKKKGTAVPKE